jgi:calpain-15
VSSACGFEDADFPASAASLGEVHSEVGPVVWYRAAALMPPGHEVKLYNGIEPNDVMQGALGDCWLLAATAAVAEFPAFIAQTLFVTQRANPEGKYALRLYDAAAHEWEVVTVDDRIPCERPWPWAAPEPLFAKNAGAELYVLVLEKAFAKFAGSYANIRGGSAWRAWLAMTGCEAIELIQREGSEWRVRQPDLRPDEVPRHKSRHTRAQPGDPARRRKGVFEGAHRTTPTLVFGTLLVQLRGRLCEAAYRHDALAACSARHAGQVRHAQLHHEREHHADTRRRAREAAGRRAVRRTCVLAHSSDARHERHGRHAGVCAAA